MKSSQFFLKLLYILVAAFTLSGKCSSGLGLLLGLIFGIGLGNPFADKTKTLTHKLLSLSIIGLGFGMDLKVIGHVGFQGIGYTVATIALCSAAGFLLAKILNTEKDVSTLITFGTAICGGSAIAAISPIIKAKNSDVSVSLATVFCLNAMALFLFPVIGHHFNLSETQFGLWAALGIHDTSSVVGACLAYGGQALNIGTTVKLGRALWIIPISLMLAIYMGTRNKEATSNVSQAKPKKPWFILGFLMASALVSFVPEVRGVGHAIEYVARLVLVLTLFIIGSNLTRATLKNVGIKPLVLGVILWITMGVSTLVAILNGWMMV